MIDFNAPELFVILAVAAFWIWATMVVVRRLKKGRGA